MTQEQILDEEMECMIRWNDPFSGRVLWHVSRVWERLCSPRHNPITGNSFYSVETLKLFRAEVDRALNGASWIGYTPSAVVEESYAWLREHGFMR